MKSNRLASFVRFELTEKSRNYVRKPSRKYESAQLHLLNVAGITLDATE